MSSYGNYGSYGKYSSSNSGIGCSGWLTIVGIILILFYLGTAIYRPFNKASNEREIIVTVTDKAVKNYNDESKYLIFTEDAEGTIQTFEVTDSLVMGRFDSSDVYAGIKVGSTYKFTIAGSRNEVMSWYPNIYDYELIEVDTYAN